MTRPRRRRFALLVLLAPVLIASTGCGSDEEPAASPDASAASEPEASTERSTPTSAPSSAPPTTSVSADSEPSAGCAPPAAADPPPVVEDGTVEVTVDGTARTYLLSSEGTEAEQPAPVMVLLHGMGSTAEDINRVSDLPARAAETGTIVVTPQAIGDPTIWQPSASGPDADLLDRILTDLGESRCIDTARIHLAGFSVGAALAAAYACARQDRVASIATVTVEAPAGCTEPMPILSFHGTADPIVAYGNADPAAGPVTGTEANMATWADTAGCAPEPTVTEVGSEVTRLEWTGCADGAEVVLYRIEGGAHDWPGKDPATAIVPSTQQVSATDQALEFAARHHR